MDRHKGKRTYTSGSLKRKLAREKYENLQKELPKIQKLTDYVKVTPKVNIDHEQTEKEVEVVNCEVAELELERTDSNESEHPKTADNIHINDIGLWSDNISRNEIEYWAENGSKKLQNCDKSLFNIKSLIQKDGKVNRKCNINLFERKNTNEERISRSWLCFSPTTGKVYCFICKLLSNASDTQLTKEGFYDWKHPNRLCEHETSKEHVQAVVEIASIAKNTGRIDSELEKQAKQAETYWKKVLERVVSVLKFICERGLAIRGDNEIIGSPRNGNFLGIIELLSEYDDFLKNHIENHANRGSGHTSYLSSTIVEEIVNEMGLAVLNEIVLRIKKSKYFSVSLDSTRDESHIDQLTVIFRYMENDSPVERFVTFLANQGHKSQEMFDSLVKLLSELGIDLQNCRGQSYDNASAMSGKFNGLQAKVAAVNPLAYWIPCAGHSLNLVGKAAAECCTQAIAFFDFMEALFVFFTTSTKRNKLLIDTLKEHGDTLVLQRLSQTRWSAQADATKALVKGYEPIKNALLNIAKDEDEIPRVRCEADGLYRKMCSLEIGTFSALWNSVLERVNATNHVLQNPKLDLFTAVAFLKSLKEFIESKRDCFDEYESQGKQLSGSHEYSLTQKRQRQSNVRLAPLDYEASDAVEMTSSQRFRVEAYIPIFDKFVLSLKQRLEAYENVCSLFGFLNNLESLSPVQIEKAAENLVHTYPKDVGPELGNELIQFAKFASLFKDEKHENIGKCHFLYKLIFEKHVLDAFPNVEIILRTYLVLMVTNCSGERSFSKLKLIKNRLRTVMGQTRLSYLCLLSIESDVLKQIDCNELITKFSKIKSRNKYF